MFYIIKKEKLKILPQPKHSSDQYLMRMMRLFRRARWLGIAGTSQYYWRLWGVLLLLVLIIVEIGAIWKVVKALAGWAVSTSGHRSVTARLAGATLYANAVLSIMLSWKLSTRWRKITDFWILIERAVAASNIPRDESLDRKMTAVTKLFIVCGLCHGIILRCEDLWEGATSTNVYQLMKMMNKYTKKTFAILEHMLSIVAVVGFNCPPSLWLEKYVLTSHGFLLQPSDYSVSVGVSLIVLSVIATVLWNFQDLIIILITLGLASRYRRINKYVATICAKDKKDIESKNSDTLELFTWRKVREAYVKQAILVRKVDDALGPLILLSSSCNFYFICLQLFLGITQAMSDTRFQQMYYILSFIWLCIRTISVVLSAADVNVCSKAALPYLFVYRTQSYNLEIERLQYQLSKDFVALSGMGFFYLTKSLLLQMAGAVVTYELVLIQLDGTDRNSTNTTTF